MGSEMCIRDRFGADRCAVALLAEGVDRNLCLSIQSLDQLLSPSSRRAWIEMAYPSRSLSSPFVALLAEGVDRNGLPLRSLSSPFVALLAEGVDRNHSGQVNRAFSPVALLAEGVDRNQAGALLKTFDPGRPPRGGRG